jgi:hypothetical protein
MHWFCIERNKGIGNKKYIKKDSNMSHGFRSETNLAPENPTNSESQIRHCERIALTGYLLLTLSTYISWMDSIS